MDAAVPQLDGELLATMFGLTSAEQRVALLLAQGLTADDMAARLGVQDNTVRSHVKQLLAKTQTHRQVQLVALLWRSAAVSHAGHEASTPAPLMPGGAPPVPPASCPNG
ncbi:MAG: LuxR family transcriptional regulator [Rubrivivax sp.]|nr:MAG: LuxR family transcriptional regulator [Rubrivivax sp.]